MTTEEDQGVPPQNESQVILIVDDDEHITVAVKAFLEAKGYKVAVANNGQAGLLKAQAFRPNLLICDVMMPVMDGWTLIKHVRIIPELAFTPVIFLTALGGSDDRLKGFQLGADDFMPKPFDFTELADKVRNVLASSRQSIEALESEMQNLAKDDYVFQGQLENFSLCSLITMSKMESHSGLLMLRNAQNDAGYLHVQSGEVISAWIEGANPLRNEDAVYVMVSWGEGSFEFRKKDTSAIEREIDVNTDFLLMEAVRRLDEGITT